MAVGTTQEQLPLSNRRSTILGSTIPFLIIASLAVGLRLYARIKVTRGLGWDDAFVLLAWVSVTIGCAFVYVSTDLGLGHSFFSLSPKELYHYLWVFYVANATYASSTAFIKLSLLLQYLRMPVFREGLLRKICIGLVVIVSLWGSAMIVMSWAPCIPVQAFWDWSVPATCYGFGTKTEKPFSATFEAQEATNAFLDVVVLFFPIIPYLRRDLTRREIIAVSILSCIGLSVVGAAMGHLGTLVIHRAGWKPHMNLTWYAPLPILLACIEVDLAIVAASIPIFWPVIEARFDEIFVTREVTVTLHRLDDDNELEMGSASMRTDSETNLHRKESLVDYNNAYFRDDPQNAKAHGHITHIETVTAKGKTSLVIPRKISI